MIRDISIAIWPNGIRDDRRLLAWKGRPPEARVADERHYARRVGHLAGDGSWFLVDHGSLVKRYALGLGFPVLRLDPNQ